MLRERCNRFHCRPDRTTLQTYCADLLPGALAPEAPEPEALWTSTVQSQDAPSDLRGCQVNMDPMHRFMTPLLLKSLTVGLTRAIALT